MQELPPTGYFIPGRDGTRARQISRVVGVSARAQISRVVRVSARALLGGLHTKSIGKHRFGRQNVFALRNKISWWYVGGSTLDGLGYKKHVFGRHTEQQTTDASMFHH